LMVYLRLFAHEEHFALTRSAQVIGMTASTPITDACVNNVHSRIGGRMPQQ
jgi:hypothetical protein